jgi:31-O-methyltransferase
MHKLNTAKVEEPSFKVSHPVIGEIYCPSVLQARHNLQEICDDKIYLQGGVSVSPGDVVLDIGANIGVFTLFVAKQGAKVYAYEPMPPTFAVLQRNVEAHGLDGLVQTRNIGFSDRLEEKMMFHYPNAPSLDAWSAQDDKFRTASENWEEALKAFAIMDPEQFLGIRSLASRSEQQAAFEQRMKAVSSSVQIKCKFDTLSNVMVQERLESIDLLKLDAELADWEILNGTTDRDWKCIRQLAMEVHAPDDVAPIAHFFRERGFRRVNTDQLRLGTGCIWAIK